MSYKNPNAQFKGFDDFVEIVKIGNHTAMSGDKVSFTAADLDQMVANTQPNTAPIVIGHPKANAPAFGWGVEYKREGDSLFAKFDQVNPQFSEWVEKGAYKKRSVSVVKTDNGWKIKHIGWLGAAAPAMEGMADMEFSADENEVNFEFTEAQAFSEIGWQFQTVGELFRGLREQLIEKEGVEVADKFFPAWQINSLQNARDTILARLNNDNDFAPVTMRPLEAAFADALEQAIVAELAAGQQQTEMQTQFDAREQELLAQNAELQAQLMRQTHENQITSWRAAGKLTPANEHGIHEFMNGLNTEQTFEFAQGETTKTLKPLEWFAQFMNAQQGVKLGIEQANEPASQPVLRDAESIKSAALAFTTEQSVKGIAVEWQDAVLHVTKEM